MARVMAFIMALSSSICSFAAEPILNRADEAFLREQAKRIVDSASLPAGQWSDKWHNVSPYDVHVPGGNMGYPAYWVRDSVMMLGADFIRPKELEGWVRLMASTLKGPQDWRVRPGVVVPAYAVPDHINFDGKPTFYPGNYETGDKQGGPPWGKYPPLDDNFYFIHAVYEHWKLTGSLDLFNSRVRTSFNDLPLSDLLEKVYRQPPSDPGSGLVVVGDIGRANAKDWGFCDGESKSGKLLFPSVLKFVAAKYLAEMFEASGQHQQSGFYRQEARRIQRALSSTFFHSDNFDGGWLHSATGVGDQPDVWGSAYAVYAGAVDTPIAMKVAHALVRAYREKTAVRSGCVRQILTADPLNKGGWQHSISKLGTYQNGGYWGTSTGWYIAAISKVDPRAAKDMASDYIQFLRNNMRPDGMAQTWEWFNPDTGQHSNPLYVATIALPYIVMKNSGLLNGK